MKRRLLWAALVGAPLAVVACSGGDSETDGGVPPADSGVADAGRDATVPPADGAPPADAAPDGDAGTTSDASVDSDASTDAGALPPDPNGVIQPGEYGEHVDGVNQSTVVQDNTYTWFMTWDDTYLYLAVRQVSGFDPVVVYMGFDPAVAGDAGSDAGSDADAGDASGNDGGAPATGTTVLLPNYDNVNGTLPFAADYVLYWKNDYDEYRTSASPTAWSAQDDARKNTILKQSTYDPVSRVDTREARVPWAQITGGGRPAGFRWLGYGVKNMAPSAQVPAANPGPPDGGAPDGGSTVAFTHYFHVTDATPGTGTKPFAVVVP